MKWQVCTHGTRIALLCSLEPLLSQMDPIHILAPVYLGSGSVSFSHPRQGLPSMWFPAHIILLDLTTLIMFSGGLQIIELFIL
jgi:hypothetical protein